MATSILKFGVKCYKCRLHYVMSLGDMLHDNGHISHNMHATDLISISKYCHSHCESIDVYSMHIDGLVAVFMVHVARDLVPLIDYACYRHGLHINRYTMTVAIF